MTIKTGKYLHYKNQYYEVYGTCHHSESGEELVLYRTLYGNYDLWVRPKAMFLENVTIEGVRKPRFKYIGPELEFTQSYTATKN